MSRFSQITTGRTTDTGGDSECARAGRHIYIFRECCDLPGVVWRSPDSGPLVLKKGTDPSVRSIVQKKEESV